MNQPKSFLKKRIFRNSPFLSLDHVDTEIYNLTKLMLMNNVMEPIVHVLDTFWISKLGNSNVVGGEGSAKELFSSLYNIASFAPSVVTPIISKYHASHSIDNISEVATTSAVVVFSLGLLMSFFMVFKTNFIINKIISSSSRSYLYATQYFQLRSITFSISLLNSLAYAIMRGKKDLNTSFRINMISQLINAVTHPILMIFLGIRGVALGTVISEFISFYLFYTKLFCDKTLRLTSFNYNRIPSLVEKGINVQIRSLCISSVTLVGLKRVQSFDTSNTLVTAHILNNQLFNFGYIVSQSLGSVGAILIPRYKRPKTVKHKLYFWGGFNATMVMMCHFFVGNLLHIFTKNPHIILVAKQIIPIAALYQFSCGLTSITEGILQGHAKYGLLCISSFFSYITFAVMLPFTKTLSHIWTALCLTNSFRFIFNIFSLYFIDTDCKNTQATTVPYKVI